MVTPEQYKEIQEKGLNAALAELDEGSEEALTKVYLDAGFPEKFATQIANNIRQVALDAAQQAYKRGHVQGWLSSSEAWIAELEQRRTTLDADELTRVVLRSLLLNIR